MLRRATLVTPHSRMSIDDGGNPRSPRGNDERRAERLHDISTLISAHLDDPSDTIAGLRLFTTDQPGTSTSSVAEASLAFVAQGRKQIAVNDHVWQYGPGDYLVVSVDLPVTGRFVTANKAEPFLGIGLTLDTAAIAALLLERDAVDARPTAIARRPALGVGVASDDLLDAVARLLRLLNDRYDRDVLAPLVLREILWRLLRGPQGDLLRDIATHGSALAQIGSAVRTIRAHYAEPFRVEDLARQAAMSVPNFHRHFRSATTMSPIQYQKKIRLQQARLSLYGSSADVTSIAHDVGYGSASQFSREYRREYGLSPVQDAARTRRPGNPQTLTGL